MSIRRISYSGDKKITSLAVQEALESLWVAFAINSDGNCIIERQFIYQPSQVFYSIEREVENIPKLVCDATKVYVAYEDEELLGEIFTANNPLTSSVEISIPSGVDTNEFPVDVQVDNTDLWFLLPGSTSSTNAKLLHYDTSGNYQETIELNTSGMEVTDASSMAIDDVGDIWIVTNTSPATIVRVFALSGGGWDYEITDIV